VPFRHSLRCANNQAEVKLLPHKMLLHDAVSVVLTHARWGAEAVVGVQCLCVLYDQHKVGKIVLPCRVAISCKPARGCEILGQRPGCMLAVLLPG